MIAVDLTIAMNAGEVPPFAWSSDYSHAKTMLSMPFIMKETDKSVVFRLYLPGVEFPKREAEFRVKDLMYHGKLAM